ncbi:hypothetical protein [Yoonia sp. SS1-5]|uniref:Heme oxygenase n=1 Tax=Yoonia rhodophyticola TaxID=3137370 RepID=A0AAN0M6T9_9RHOB
MLGWHVSGAFDPGRPFPTVQTNSPHEIHDAYLIFLRTHQLAHRALLSALPSGHWVSGMLGSGLMRLDADLLRLRVAPAPRPMVGLLHPLRPLGVAYAICGSQFSKALQRRHWAPLTKTDLPPGADNYLHDEAVAAGWKRCLAEIEDLADPIRDLQKLGEDADRTLALFHDCLASVKRNSTQLLAAA